MTGRNMMLFAAFGSFSLLAGAFIFQTLGYAPCQMCLWQRWPHAAAVGIGALVLITGPFVFLALTGALSALATSAIGVFHTGVERGWWEGPSSCSGGGGGLERLSGQELLSLEGPTNIIMCDEVAWAFLGVSMASWNAIFSLGLAMIWVLALRRA